MVSSCQRATEFKPSYPRGPQSHPVPPGRCYAPTFVSPLLKQPCPICPSHWPAPGPGPLPEKATPYQFLHTWRAPSISGLRSLPVEFLFLVEEETKLKVSHNPFHRSGEGGVSEFPAQGCSELPAAGHSQEAQPVLSPRAAVTQCCWHPELLALAVSTTSREGARGQAPPGQQPPAPPGFISLHTALTTIPPVPLTGPSSAGEVARRVELEGCFLRADPGLPVPYSGPCW